MGQAIVNIIRLILVAVIGFAIVLLVVAGTSDEGRASFSDGVLTGIGGTVRQLPGLIQDIRDAV
jgi:hypothetical protein